MAALRHPLLQAAASAAFTHREAPFLLPRGDGQVLEGVIDLVFRGEDDWVVVDFKTDEIVDTLVERYSSQVGWYVEASRRLLGGDARGILLAV